jgi:hypothetical protein
MKLLFYVNKIRPHHKNLEGIQLMCKSKNIDFEYTNRIERIKENNYQILYCICDFIDPYIIPENIKIVYGPQFWVIPKPPLVGKYNKELENRCVYNTLSPWVKNYIQEIEKEYIIPLECFPFAINIDKFKPLETNKEYDCILYIKRRDKNLINYVVKILENNKINFKIFKYGYYIENDYLETLHKSKFMIVLDAHESQGFALQEAMSCGIPLLVFDSTTMYDEMNDGINSTYEYLKPKKLYSTSVPYWSDNCGIKINDNFEEKLFYMLNNYKNYNTREYIINNLSPEICMQKILNYFKL